MRFHTRTCALTDSLRARVFPDASGTQALDHRIRRAAAAGRPLTKEPTMTGKYLNHRLRAIVAALTALATGVIGVCVAAPALASPLPAPGYEGGHAVAPVRLALAGGVPGWQVALIAIMAAVVASIAAVTLDRARSARRHPAPQAS
jgi:hypothetical protein